MEQEHNNQQEQLKPSQQLAYKRVLAENKRLRERVVKLETELEILKSFIGLEANK